MLDVSVVLPALNESGNIIPLLQGLRGQFDALNLSYEVIVVDGGSKDSTREDAISQGAICFLQKRPGYGGALREGIERATGRYVLTLDCDQSHSPDHFPELWALRDTYDVVVASRFVEGGESKADLHRKWLSIILNTVFKRLLRVSVNDSSSGYRLYRREVLRPSAYKPENFNVLQEILVRAISDGFSVGEIPLRYRERIEGASHASVVKFAYSYLATLYRLWVLRHSPASADYEHNAYDSRHLLQRAWQRGRCRQLSSFTIASGTVADVGCGSSRSAQQHPETLCIDHRIEKLRFLKRSNPFGVQADAAHLPLKDASLDQLVLSQLLPEVDDPRRVLCEANRVLRRMGSLLVVIPDRSRIAWKVIGFMYRLLPNVRGVPLKSELTGSMLTDLLAECGFRTEKRRYLFAAELTVAARKLEEVA